MFNFISKTNPFFLVIIVLILSFLWWPFYGNFSELRTELSQIEKKLEGESDFSDSIKETLKKLEDYKQEIEKITFAIPDDPSVPEMFNFIQNESRYNGMILKDISIDRTIDSEKHPNMEKTLILASLSGSYEATKNFLSSLHKNVRLVGVESFSFKIIEDEERESFDLDLIIKSYSQKPFNSSGQPAGSPGFTF